MVYTANIVRLHFISKYRDWEQLSYDDFGGRAVGISMDVDIGFSAYYIVFLFLYIHIIQYKAYNTMNFFLILLDSNKTVFLL